MDCNFLSPPLGQFAQLQLEPDWRDYEAFYAEVMTSPSSDSATIRAPRSRTASPVQPNYPPQSIARAEPLRNAEVERGFSTPPINNGAPSSAMAANSDPASQRPLKHLRFAPEAAPPPLLSHDPLPDRSPPPRDQPAQLIQTILGSNIAAELAERRVARLVPAFGKFKADIETLNRNIQGINQQLYYLCLPPAAMNDPAIQMEVARLTQERQQKSLQAYQYLLHGR